MKEITNKLKSRRGRPRSTTVAVIIEGIEDQNQSVIARPRGRPRTRPV